jgi:hypothetical protein
MIFQVSLNSLAARLALVGGAVLACALAAVIVASHFIVGTLTDKRYAWGRETLLVPASYFPNSARLNARLAEAEIVEADRDLASAEFHARRAAELSPYDYRCHLTIASVSEARGNRAAAEAALRAAMALAPNLTEVRWRLANLLVREGKLGESLALLETVNANDILRLPASLDLAWRASRGSFEMVEPTVPADPKARLTFAQFLLKQSRPAEAAAVFSQVDRRARLAWPESAAVLNSLIAAGRPDLARPAWLELVGAGAAQSSPVWNGGFESDTFKDFSQFDWSIGRSDYARIGIDATVAHGGARSLKIIFAGRDTTKLDGEVKQLVAVRPGARYRLECYVKTEGLVTTEGPRIVVTDGASNPIAASDPIASGSSDWRLLAVEFQAPPTASGVYITLRRKPRFSYEDPTLGAIWLDDFVMKEQE